MGAAAPIARLVFHGHLRRHGRGCLPEPRARRRSVVHDQDDAHPDAMAGRLRGRDVEASHGADRAQARGTRRAGLHQEHDDARSDDRVRLPAGCYQGARRSQYLDAGAEHDE